MQIQKINVNNSQNQRPAFKKGEKGVFRFATKAMESNFLDDFKRVSKKEPFLKTLLKMWESKNQFEFTQMGNAFLAKTNSQVIAKGFEKDFKLVDFVIKTINDFAVKLEIKPKEFQKVEISDFLGI